MIPREHLFCACGGRVLLYSPIRLAFQIVAYFSDGRLPARTDGPPYRFGQSKKSVFGAMKWPDARSLRRQMPGH